MQITFSLLTLFALMPLSLHAWNSVGTRSIQDADLFNKIPYERNPFSIAETKKNILARFYQNYGNRNIQLNNKFKAFYNGVQQQWDIWMKDFYAATSTDTWTVTGAGLNAWRAQAEEHFLGIARSVSTACSEYDLLLVQEMLVGFKVEVLLPMLLVRRLNKRGIFSNANTLLRFNFCWPSKTYKVGTQMVTVLDNCGPNRRCVGYSNNQDYRIPISGPVLNTIKIGGICLPCPANNPICKPSANYYTVVPNKSQYSHAWYQLTETPIYRS